MSTCQGALGSTLCLNPAHWTLTVVCESDIHKAFVTSGLELQQLCSKSRALRHALKHTHIQSHSRSKSLRRRRNRYIPCVNISKKMMLGTEKAQPRWGLSWEMNRGQLWLLCCTASIWLKSCQPWDACRAWTGGGDWGGGPQEAWCRERGPQTAKPRWVSKLDFDAFTLIWPPKFKTISSKNPLKPCTKPNGRLTKTTTGTRVLRWGWRLFLSFAVQFYKVYRHHFLLWGLLSPKTHFNLEAGLWPSLQSKYHTPHQECQGFLGCFKDLKTTYLILPQLQLLERFSHWVASLLDFSFGHKHWEKVYEVSYCVRGVLSVAQ